MSKIGVYPGISLFCVCFVLFFLVVPLTGFGKNVMQVETGSYQSASWQFTIELSELWQKQFPEEESGFDPSFTEMSEDRFRNLIAKNSRFVIAPLDSTANQIMLSRPVKLMSLLWTVYLVPIDIGRKNKKISLNNYRYWYIPENAIIVSRLMQALSKPDFSETVHRRFQGRLPGTELGPQDKLEAKVTESVNRSFGENANTQSTGQQQGHTFDSEELSSERNSLIFRQSAKIAGLNSFETEILRVDSSMIPEIVEEYREGILFFEMMGSINHLKKSFTSRISTAPLKQNIQDFLVSIHPWIQPVYKNRVGLRTLEFNMAMFVHEDEDPEFVENLIKLLSERQKTYFPVSFIFKNLAIQKTKDLSPLYLHAGSLKYFDLD